MTADRNGAPRDDESDPDGTPWWASQDPAGHGGDRGSKHGEHVRPAWMDAVEALDGAVRAAARSARAAQERVSDARDGLGGRVDGVPGQGPDDDGLGGGSGGGSGGGAGGSGGSGGGGGIPAGHQHGAIDAYCHICPVCALLRALEDVKPEVLVHLSEAARHLTLAAKAVVDSQAERAGGTDDLEEIPFDE